MSTTDAKQYLTFSLDGEVFAVDILSVREVLTFSHVTRMPRVAPFMMGVINLRGSVVPVVDLKKKFGFPECAPTVDTCIVIIEVQHEDDTLVLGALCDTVREVLELRAEHIEEAPKVGTRLKTEFIRGMGKQSEENGDDFIIILDVDLVFSADEMIHVARIEDTDPTRITEHGQGSGPQEMPQNMPEETSEALAAAS